AAGGDGGALPRLPRRLLQPFGRAFGHAPLHRPGAPGLQPVRQYLPLSEAATAGLAERSQRRRRRPEPLGWSRGGGPQGPPPVENPFQETSNAVSARPAALDSGGRGAAGAQLLDRGVDVHGASRPAPERAAAGRPGAPGRSRPSRSEPDEAVRGGRTVRGA